VHARAAASRRISIVPLLLALFAAMVELKIED